MFLDSGSHREEYRYDVARASQPVAITFEQRRGGIRCKEAFNKKFEVCKVGPWQKTGENVEIARTLKSPNICNSSL